MPQVWKVVKTDGVELIEIGSETLDQALEALKIPKSMETVKAIYRRRIEEGG